MESINWDLKASMIAVAIAACLSFMSSSMMLVYLSISYIQAKWARNVLEKNHQVVILIFNLFLGDFLQSVGFGLNCLWLAQNKFVVGRLCFVQGTLIQIGDLASSSFVVSIALHTFARIYLRRVLGRGLFVSCILFIWLGSLFTGIGLPWIARIHSPLPGHYFSLAGSWCWINPELVKARLLSHYVLIFLYQVICAVSYSLIYIKLSKASSTSILMGTQKRSNNVERAARIMVVYPVAYICCTLPLCIVRLRDMVGSRPSFAMIGFAGAVFTSSGLMNSIMYGITRKLHRRPEPVGSLVSVVKTGQREECALSGLECGQDSYRTMSRDEDYSGIKKPDQVFCSLKTCSPVILVRSDTFMRTETCSLAHSRLPESRVLDHLNEQDFIYQQSET